MSGSDDKTGPAPELPPMDTKPMSFQSISGVTNPLAVARTLVDLFSTVDARPPPSDTKQTHLRLVTIAPSPFCEKVRWALDTLEDDPSKPYFYTEDSHPAAFHAFFALPITNGTSSRTPIVVFPDGTYLTQSEVILKELYPSLYPEAIVKELDQFEADIGTRLGTPTRTFAYHYLLDPEKKFYPSVIKASSYGTSNIEKTLFEKMLDKGIDQAFRKGLKINEETTRLSVEAMRQVFAEVSDRLQKNGGEYIMDTPEQKYGFTVADLAFASYSYMIVGPSEMSHFFGPLEEWPPEAVQIMQELRATPAAEHCRRVYRLHRPVFADDGKVRIRTGNRDKNPLKEGATRFYLGAAFAAMAASVVWLVGSRKK